MRTVEVTGDPLALDDVVAVARGSARATMSAGVPARMARARAVVEDAVAHDRVMYGITTGFGLLADTRIAPDELALLQLSLVRSHAAATGEPLGDEVVRGLLLLRARTLAAGLSGVRPDLPARLLEMLDRGLLPVDPVPGQRRARRATSRSWRTWPCPLVGEGRLRRAGDDPRGRPAAEVLAEEGLAPLVLEPKEGLSLINGTEPMQSLLAPRHRRRRAVVLRSRTSRLPRPSRLCSAPTARTTRASSTSGRTPASWPARPTCAGCCAGSPLLASHRHSDHAVQDSYSLRCAPQVHGAVRDLVAYGRRTIEIELGSVVDNPVIVEGIDGGPDEVMSTGNFHGEPLAFAGDAMRMCLSELASISERRTDRMLDPAFNRGLPPFLAPKAGTNSGFMLAQYTAASLVSENKVLAHPSSVDTIPTSGNQEDHVSMGWTSDAAAAHRGVERAHRARRRAAVRRAGDRPARRRRAARRRHPRRARRHPRARAGDVRRPHRARPDRGRRRAARPRWSPRRSR